MQPLFPISCAIEVSNQLAGGITITNNFVNLQGPLGVEAGNGILINQVFNSTANCLVNNNVIRHAVTGINVLSHPGAVVEGNNIQINRSNAQLGATGSFPLPLVPNHSGVRVANSMGGVQVRGNTIRRLSGWQPGQVVNPNQYRKLSGVWVENSPNINVADNQALRMLAGIYVRQRNPAGLLQCNTLQQGKSGIYFSDATINGVQVPGAAQGNRFIADDGPYRLEGVLLTPVDWHSQTVQLFNPSPIDPNLIGLLDIMPSVVQNSNCSFSGPVGPGPKRNFLVGPIVRGEHNFTQNPTENSNWERLYAYSLLRSDTSLLHLGLADDADYVNFYQAEDATLSRHICMFEEAIRQNDNTTATQCNHLLGSTHTYDVYQRLVNDIYLSTWHVDVFTFDSTQQATLEFIACQNPIEYGRAVYAAQALLQGRFICDNENRSFVPHTGEEGMQSIAQPITLYPNPTDGRITLSGWEGEEPATFILTDLTGRRVHQAQVTAAETQIALPRLADGLYMWQVQARSGAIQSGKLQVKQ